MPHPMLPICFCCRPNVLVSLSTSLYLVGLHRDLRNSFCSQVLHVVGLLVVLSVNVLHIVALSLCCIRHSSFPHECNVCWRFPISTSSPSRSDHLSIFRRPCCHRTAARWHHHFGSKLIERQTCRRGDSVPSVIVSLLTCTWS